MQNSICVKKHRCALKDIVSAIAHERDENREAQTQREWRHIAARAEREGDSLGGDCPMIWG